MNACTLTCPTTDEMIRETYTDANVFDASALSLVYFGHPQGKLLANYDQYQNATTKQWGLPEESVAPLKDSPKQQQQNYSTTELLHISVIAIP